MRVTITSPDLKQVVGELRDMGDRANSRALLDSREVRSDLEHASARRFSRGLKANTKGWRLEKQARGLSARPMQMTGAAFMALTRGTGPAAGAVIFEASPTGVTWGVRPGSTDLFYVKIHAKGYRTRGGTQVKPRRVVVVDKTARENIAGRVVRILANEL